MICQFVTGLDMSLLILNAVNHLSFASMKLFLIFAKCTKSQIKVVQIQFVRKHHKITNLKYTNMPFCQRGEN